MKTRCLLCLVLVTVYATANADIIPSFDGASAFGNTAVWNYSIDVTELASVTTGDYFTIYDFGNFIPGSNSQPIGWSLTTSLVGTTPGQINPTDNPSLLNLTWTFIGPTIVGPSSNIGDFRVTILGPVGAQATSQFAALATRSSGPNAGTKLANIGAINVPTAIPEPSAVTLLAFGGMCVIARAINRHRRRRP